VLLPNAEDAIVDPEKLRDYLLSHEHPHGRFKARFFDALGFRAERWQELELALRTQHLTQDAEAVPVAADGHKFRIRATLVGPEGESAMVVSIWFIRANEAAPRFVTAFPGGRR
jgi:hypothetical protein